MQYVILNQNLVVVRKDICGTSDEILIKLLH